MSPSQPPGAAQAGLHCAGRWLDLSQPRLMAVLNTTPDSFSDGGDYYRGQQLDMDMVLRRCEHMLAEGADLIDVGGESTRPGAAPVSVQQELDRVVPVVEAIAQRFDTIISVDSSSAEVMRAAAAAGAGLLNDVRALSRPGALAAAADSGLPVCLMHMQGEPASMQQNPDYSQVVGDVSAYLQARVEACVAQGIATQRIVLDPGFGFGKTAEHNLSLLKNLQQLVKLGFPVLVGLSRKSLIGMVTGREVAQRLPGSLALAALALSRGATILRVHDVAAHHDLIRLFQAVENAG